MLKGRRAISDTRLQDRKLSTMTADVLYLPVEAVCAPEESLLKLHDNRVMRGRGFGRFSVVAKFDTQAHNDAR